MEKLIELLNKFTYFEKAELEKVLICLKMKRIRKNDFLLYSGNVCKELYYIITGCLRFYFIDTKGNEKTRFILYDNTFGTALHSFITQEPSLEYIQAIDDSEVYAMSYEDFYRLNKELPQWREIYQKLLEVSYCNQIKRIEEMVTLTAKERYEILLKEKPWLVQKLSNKILASFLDIREETLSRIKSKF